MDSIDTLPPGSTQIDPSQNNPQPGANTQHQAAIKPWSIQSETPGDALQVVEPPRLGNGKTMDAHAVSLAGRSKTGALKPLETKDDAFIALHAASTKFQTGVMQLDTAIRQFASQEYIDSMHSSLSGIGNLMDAGGDAMEGLSMLAKLQENKTWSKPFEQASHALKNLGTPLRGAGDVLKDLDAFLKTYADPTVSADDIKLAFSSFLNSVARETGENLATLNTSVGSANEFINTFAATLQAGGNLGLGVNRIRQNIGKIRIALRDGHAQKAAAAVAGTMAGTCFLGAGLTQAAAHALKVTGYSQLGERLSHLGDATSNYGEKYEALQERLGVNSHET